MAERINLQRPAVSKMERKADMSISRFTELVEALGGGWQIRIWFEDGREHSTGVETQVALARLSVHLVRSSPHSVHRSTRRGMAKPTTPTLRRRRVAADLMGDSVL